MKRIKHVGIILTIIFSTMSIKAQHIAGDWRGTLLVQGMEIELMFHITDEDGELAATMDVPAQGAAGIPVDAIEVNGSSVMLGVSMAQITYRGELSADSINGVYEQAGMSLDLTLKRYVNKLPGNPDLVSTDEELTNLIKFQHSYNAASRYITVIDEMIEHIIERLGF